MIHDQVPGSIEPPRELPPVHAWHTACKQDKAGRHVVDCGNLFGRFGHMAAALPLVPSRALWVKTFFYPCPR
jgi:hypothetical protein